MARVEVPVDITALLKEVVVAAVLVAIPAMEVVATGVLVFLENLSFLAAAQQEHKVAVVMAATLLPMALVAVAAVQAAVLPPQLVHQQAEMADSPEAAQVVVVEMLVTQAAQEPLVAFVLSGVFAVFAAHRPSLQLMWGHK